MKSPDWLTARPVAHRGLHDADAGVIENTVPAVEAAIAGGYAVEVDLQETVEHGAVVFHDDTLDRLTTASGPVRAHSVSDLRKIAIPSGNTQIPSLDDLLDLVAGKVPLVIEVKTNWTGHGPYERGIVEKLKAYDGPAAVMSFDPVSVALFRELAPELPRGIISYGYGDEDDPRLTLWRKLLLANMLHWRRTQPTFIAYGIKDLPALAPVLRNKLGGVPLLTWTVRTDEERKRAARWTDQIIFEGFRP